jgi:ATP phosphoribosyltransferase
MKTNTQFIANRYSAEDPWKRRKIDQIVLLLKGALRAENMVGLKMNLPLKNIDEVIQILPSLTAPTVAGLYNSEWVSLEVVVDSKAVRDLIPKLIAAGAEGIIEYPLNKVI